MHSSDLETGVTLFNVRDVVFTEVPGPALSREIVAAVDSAWNAAVRDNPTLFDGPVVLCTALRELGSCLGVEWSRATYRYRTVRQISGAPALSSVFVCVVQPTTDGRLLVGRMSTSTSRPGKVQFPGGNLEPAPADAKLTIGALQLHAAVELAEETGIEADPDDLTLWVVARTSDSNVGFFFLAPSLPAAYILECHASIVAAAQSAGLDPEFEVIALVAAFADLASLKGEAADYSRPLLDRFRQTATADLELAQVLDEHAAETSESTQHNSVSGRFDGCSTVD